MQAQAVLESSATALAAPLITAKTIVHLRYLNTAIEDALEKLRFPWIYKSQPSIPSGDR
jgi:hypothetical protein